MTLCYVDTTTLYDIASAFSYSQPKDSYDWAWDNAVTFTSAALGKDWLRLSPVPNPQSQESGPLGKLLTALKGIVKKHQQMPKALDQDVKNSTIDWCAQHAATVKRSLKALEKDTGVPARWVDWHICNAWEEHVRRVGGIVDSKFKSQVAVVLGANGSKILADVQRMCLDRRKLKDIIKGRAHDDRQLAARAWIGSVLVGGVCYDYFAKRRKAQYVYHQARSKCLPDNTSRTPQEFRPTNLQHYLSNVLVAAAYRYRRHEKRIESWATSIKSARELPEGTKRALRDRDDLPDEEALETARSIAKKQMGITLTGRSVDAALEWALVISAGAVPSFLLWPWGVAVGVMAGGAAKLVADTGIVGKATRAVTTGDAKLARLAAADAGRISRGITGTIRVRED